ncbi:MAG TPA: hypothetical protein VGE45_00540 [Chloroflexia bacterium]|jgi:hypothetical protein
MAAQIKNDRADTLLEQAELVDLPQETWHDVATSNLAAAYLVLPSAAVADHIREHIAVIQRELRWMKEHVVI